MIFTQTKMLTTYIKQWPKFDSSREYQYVHICAFLKKISTSIWITSFIEIQLQKMWPYIDSRGIMNSNEQRFYGEYGKIWWKIYICVKLGLNLKEKTTNVR